MTTREKVLDISRKTIEHLKEVQKLRNESLKFYEENEEELCKLLETDDEVKKLLEEVGVQLEKFGL